MWPFSLISLAGTLIDKIFTGVEDNRNARLELMKYAMSIEGQKAMAEAQDRISARDRQSKLNDNTTTLMAIFLFVGYFAVLVAFLFLGKYFSALSPGLHDVMMLLLGSLTTAFLMVVAYYFGSSTAADKGMGNLVNNLNNDLPEKKRWDI